MRSKLCCKCSGEQGVSGTVRGHGWPRRAYRDVFTACPGNSLLPATLARTKPEAPAPTIFTRQRDTFRKKSDHHHVIAVNQLFLIHVTQHRMHLVTLLSHTLCRICTAVVDQPAVIVVTTFIFVVL